MSQLISLGETADEKHAWARLQIALDRFKEQAVAPMPEGTFLQNYLSLLVAESIVVGQDLGLFPPEEKLSARQKKVENFLKNLLEEIIKSTLTVSPNQKGKPLINAYPFDRKRICKAYQEFFSDDS